MASLPSSVDSAQANAPPSEVADEAGAGIGEVSGFAFSGIPAVVGHMVAVLRGCKRAADPALPPPPALAPPLRIKGPSPEVDPAGSVVPLPVAPAPDPPLSTLVDPPPPALPALTEQQSGLQPPLQDRVPGPSDPASPAAPPWFPLAPMGLVYSPPPRDSPPGSPRGADFKAVVTWDTLHAPPPTLAYSAPPSPIFEPVIADATDARFNSRPGFDLSYFQADPTGSPPPSPRQGQAPTSAIAQACLSYSPTVRAGSPEPDAWTAPPETEAASALRRRDNARDRTALPVVAAISNAYAEGTTHPTAQQRDAAALRRRAEFLVSLLPVPFLARVLDGSTSGTSQQVGPAARRRALIDTLVEAGGRDGKALTAHRTTLADLIDFGASSEPKVDVTRTLLGPAFLGAFIRHKFDLAIARSTPTLSISALRSVRFLASHCGLLAPDTEASMVTAWARSAIPSGALVPPTQQAGTIPAWLIYRLGLLAQDDPSFRAELQAKGFHPNAVVTLYARSFVLAILCGLRMRELESAQLVHDADPRVIAVIYSPKGKPALPRETSYAYAFDMLGPLTWWAQYKADMAGERVLCPGFAGGRNGSNRTDLLKAKAFHASAHKSADVPQKAWVALTQAPGFVETKAWKEEYNLTPHCVHGSMTDVCYELGEPCGLNPSVEGNILGNWTIPARPDKQGADASVPTGKSMHKRYSTGANRRGSRQDQLLARWKIWHAIHVGATEVGYDLISLPERWTQIRTAIISMGERFERADPMGPPRPAP